MPRKISDIGLKFREKFGYFRKLSKECMGKELWNEYCKLVMKERWKSPKHKKELAERKAKREQIKVKRDVERRLSGKQYQHYCKNIELVENFSEAKKDNFKGWILHHKLEQMFTAEELNAMGIYYDCKPGELMFIKASEHNNNLRLHYGCRIRDKSKCGRQNKNKK